MKENPLAKIMQSDFIIKGLLCKGILLSRGYETNHPNSIRRNFIRRNIIRRKAKH